MFKKILLFFILCTNICYSNQILLNGVETTTVSSSIVSKDMELHTLACHFTNSGGSVTALTVDLEGSIDNSHWFQIGTVTFDSSELSAKEAMINVSNTYVTYVRSNITTLTETGTTAVYVYYNSYSSK